MAHIKVIRWAAFVVFAVLLVCGCEQNTKDPVGDDSAFLGSSGRKLELQQMLNRKYGDPEIHYELGKIYQAEGQFDKAVFSFTVAKSYDPVNWKSAAAIVKTYYQQGKKDRAIATAEKYIKDANYSASSSLSLGKAFQDEHLDDEALVCYNQAIKIAPTSAELNKQMGIYYREKNDLVRAEQYLIRSFELEPTAEVAKELGKLGISVELPGFPKPKDPAPAPAPVEEK